MAITNFEFPGVTLDQVFERASTGTVSTLSAACIGRQFKLHRSDVASEAIVLSQPEGSKYDETNGLTVTLPVSADVIDAEITTQKLVVRDGIWAYGYATTLSPTITSVANKAIKFSAPVKDGAGKTADSIFLDRGLAVGDPIIISSDGTSISTEVVGINTVGTEGFVEVRVRDIGSFDTESTIEVAFCLLQGAKYGASTSTFAITSNNVVIEGALTVALAERGGSMGTLIAGDLLVEFREFADTYVGKLGSVSDPRDVERLLGGVTKDNPLALAVFFAVMAAKGTTVFFTGVSDESPANYADALGFLERRPEIYSIVPATEDQSVIREAAQICIGASEDVESKIRRTLWYGITSDVTGPLNEDIIVDIISKRYVSSYRAQAVWADGVLFRGERVPNFAVAAAAAGMRSFEPAHRPVSNLSYAFFSLEEPNGFSRAQLKRVGEEGIWIIANNHNDIPINMRQITSAMTNNLNLDEESIVACADEIALGLVHIGEDKVGCSNISPDLLSALSMDISLFMDSRLRNTGGNIYVGPQLISWKLLDMRQDEVNRDWVYATIVCEPPKPFNQFKMTMRVI